MLIRAIHATQSYQRLVWIIWRRFGAASALSITVRPKRLPLIISLRLSEACIPRIFHSSAPPCLTSSPFLTTGSWARHSFRAATARRWSASARGNLPSNRRKSGASYSRKNKSTCSRKPVRPRTNSTGHQSSRHRNPPPWPTTSSANTTLSRVLVSKFCKSTP